MAKDTYSKRWYEAHKEQAAAANRKYHQTHREHVKQRDHAYYLAHKAEIAAKNRWLSIKNLYGLTPEQFNELYQLQGGRCLLCNKHQSETNGALCVDHNHDTGQVRGLLCRRCNAAIGLLNEDVEILRRAVAYLEGEQHEQ